MSESVLFRSLETLHWEVTLRSAAFLRAPALLPLAAVLEDGGRSEWDPDLPAFATLEEALAATCAEAVVLDGLPEFRSERVMQALALDLHVLVEPPLGEPEEMQRCALIAQNRGVRLMIAERRAYADPDALALAFARYALEDVEPPTSARRLC